MPLSFQPTQYHATFNDLTYAPTFSQLNYADKNLWSALFGDEIEALKENIKKNQLEKEIKARLRDFQSMVGRLTLSPVVYSLGLLDLQKFLRAEIKQPEIYLEIIKETRQEWRETLRNQKAFTLENFFTDVSQAIQYVIEAKWEVQTAQDVLNYYWHLIDESFYQRTVGVVKSFLNKFFIKEFVEDEGIQILTENDIQAIRQQLHQIFTAAVAKLPNAEKSSKENHAEKIIAETNNHEKSNENYLNKAWSATKAVGQYVLDHPVQAVIMGLAAQTASAAAFNSARSFNKRVIGDEFQVTYTTGIQEFPAIGSLNNGNFVVVWQSDEQDGSNYGIYGQIFNNTNGKEGGEFRANSNTYGRQATPAITGLNNGNFVIVWQSDTFNGIGTSVNSQLFDSTGAMLETEFQVNNYTFGDRGSPAVSGLINSNFVVVWQSDTQDGSGYGVYGQIFNGTVKQFDTEFRVNTHILDDQRSPAVAGLSNGNFVVVWSGLGQDGPDSGVYGQIFNGLGERIESEFSIKTNAGGQAVIGLSNGNFVVACQGDSVAGSSEIYGQLFDALGTRVGGTFRANTYTSSIQCYPAIASLSDGSFMIVWQSYGQDGSGYGVYGQLFDTSGARSGELQINTYTLNDQSIPAIVSLNNSNFAVVWQSYGDGYGLGVFGKVLNAGLFPSASPTPTTPSPSASLTPTPFFTPSPSSSASVTPMPSPIRSIDVTFQVNTYMTNKQDLSAVASLNNGNFVVVWQSFAQDGSSYGVYGQIFAGASSQSIGTEFQVNTQSSASQNLPAVAGSNSGNFMVVWVTYGQDGLDYGIYGQLFHILGAKSGGEIQINTYTLGAQTNPKVTSLKDGNFVVVWQSDGQDGSGWGIYGQLYTNAAEPICSEFQVNTYTTNDQQFPAVASLADGNFIVVWVHTAWVNPNGKISRHIYGQRFNNTTERLGSEIQINTNIINGLEFSPAIAGLSNGNFVVIWNNFYSNAIPAGTWLCSQVFNSVGEGLGSEYDFIYYDRRNFIVDAIGDSPAIADLDNGNFILVWSRAIQNPETGHTAINNLYGQLFNYSGAKVGNDSMITNDIYYNNAYHPSQYLPVVAALSNGNIVVSWSFSSYNFVELDEVLGKVINLTVLFPSEVPFISPSFTPPCVTIMPSHISCSSNTPTATPSTIASTSAVLSTSPTSTAGDHAKSTMSILDVFLKVSLPTTVGATLLLIAGWKIRNYLKAKHNDNEQSQASNRNSFFANKATHQDEEVFTHSMESMGIAEGSDMEDEGNTAPELIHKNKH